LCNTHSDTNTHTNTDTYSDTDTHSETHTYSYTNTYCYSNANAYSSTYSDWRVSLHDILCLMSRDHRLSGRYFASRCPKC
jgi:hypothetical protein